MTPFSLIMAVTTLIHRLSVHSWLLPLPLPTGWLSLGFTIWLLFRPSSTFVLAGFLITGMAEWIRELPIMPNHFFFEGLVHTTMLLVLATHGWRARSSTIDRRRLFEELAPIIRVEVLLLYGLAVLHKLNRDYFNPEVSCAVELHDQIANVLPLVPTGSWTHAPVIALSLAFEAGIPILLSFRRSAHIGIALGVLFHGVLSLHPHYGVFSFSALMFAFLCLFLSKESFVRLEQLWRDGLRTWQRLVPCLGPKRLVLVTFGATLAIQVGWGAFTYKRATIHELLAGLTRIGFWAWLPFGVFLGASYGLAIYRAGRARGDAPVGSARLSAGWVILPAIVLNGLSPYIGLKTATTFSMFSNLRTEREPNHWFMPQLYLLDAQLDTVEILWSSRQGSEEACKPPGATLQCSYPGQRAPYFEFRRWTSEYRGYDGEPLRVTFVRNGQVYELGPQGDPALARSLYTPHPFLARKLMTLRHVETERRVKCGW